MMWKFIWVACFVWNAISAAGNVNSGEYGWAVLSSLAAIFALTMLVLEEIRS